MTDDELRTLRPRLAPHDIATDRTSPTTPDDDTEATRMRPVRGT
jgi:hypothetical protein